MAQCRVLRRLRGYLGERYVCDCAQLDFEVVCVTSTLTLSDLAQVRVIERLSLACDRVGNVQSY